GFITAYPMNWWLVTYHLKHGMMTVRPAATDARGDPVRAGMDDAPHAAAGVSASGGEAPRPPVPVMALLSFLAVAVGAALALLSRSLLATESRSNALRNCLMAWPAGSRPQSGRVWKWPPAGRTQLAAMPPGTALARRAPGQRRSAASACSPARVRARALT